MKRPPKIDPEQTMAWKMVKPESQTDAVRMVIQMAWSEGWMDGMQDAEQIKESVSTLTNPPLQ